MKNKFFIICSCILAGLNFAVYIKEHKMLYLFMALIFVFFAVTAWRGPKMQPPKRPPRIQHNFDKATKKKYRPKKRKKK